MRPKITSWDLQQLRDEMLQEDEEKRRYNRIYVQHLDQIGAHNAWESFREYVNRTITINKEA